MHSIQSTLDTVLPADCIKVGNNFIAIATYFLNENTKTGSIIITDLNLDILNEFKSSAVLDIKIKENKIFSANSDSKVCIFDAFTGLKQEFITGNGLMLAVDHFDQSLFASQDTGNLITFDLETGYSTSKRVHDAEVWALKVDQNRILTGADDCLLKILETRSDQVETIKHHSMGVTCIQTLGENEFVSGSYDETLAFWDHRNLKSPFKCLNTVGGVWRIEPKKDYLAVACMYGGAQIFNKESSFNFKEHGSIVYGIDWLDDNTLVSCSFYDHLALKWSINQKND